MAGSVLAGRAAAQSVMVMVVVVMMMMLCGRLCPRWESCSTVCDGDGGGDDDDDADAVWQALSSLGELQHSL